MVKRIDEVHYINPITGAIVNVPYICKQWRISNNYKLSDVARDTGYSLASVAGFERSLGEMPSEFAARVDNQPEPEKKSQKKQGRVWDYYFSLLLVIS